LGRRALALDRTANWRYQISDGRRRGSFASRAKTRSQQRRAAAGVSMRSGPIAHAVIVVSAALALAGCNTSGQGPASLAPGGAATVAFESIDGPPPGVFQKYVQGLEAEAQARQLAVVSRAGPAQYRVRGYLAAHVRRGRASFSWVWDVYDSEQRRALRLAGEDAAGKAGRNAWSAADDAVVRRIAKAGVERLVAFLNSGGAATDGDAPPARAGQAVAEVPPATVLARR
jgi:hypothetical protein